MLLARASMMLLCAIVQKLARLSALPCYEAWCTLVARMSAAVGLAGAALEPQGLLALIGRDVLARCTLFYNGTTGEFTLAI